MIVYGRGGSLFLEQTALGLRDFSKEERPGLPLLALALRVQSTQAWSTSGFCVKLQFWVFRYLDP